MGQIGRDSAYLYDTCRCFWARLSWLPRPSSVPGWLSRSDAPPRWVAGSNSMARHGGPQGSDGGLESPGGRFSRSEREVGGAQRGSVRRKDKGLFEMDGCWEVEVVWEMMGPLITRSLLPPPEGGAGPHALHLPSLPGYLPP